MSQSRIDELVDRLLSRKLWLCLLSVAFACWNYTEGRLSATDFQVAIFAAVGVYTVSEGLTDAVGAYRPKPSAGDTQSVAVNTTAAEPVPVPAAEMEVKPKRVRKPKVKPVEVVSRG